jgi:hypothetical protein
VETGNDQGDVFTEESTDEIHRRLPDTTRSRSRIRRAINDAFRLAIGFAMVRELAQGSEINVRLLEKTAQEMKTLVISHETIFLLVAHAMRNTCQALE